MAITDEEKALINKLTNKLIYHRKKNDISKMYYEMKVPHKNLRIAVPKAIEGLAIALSWANVVVETLNERINLDGFSAPESLGLNSIYRSNYIDVKSNQAHRESLIYGCSYIVAGAGNKEDGEPEVLATFESPNRAYGELNDRTERLNNLLLTNEKDGKFTTGTLMMPNYTLNFKYGGNNGASFFHSPRA